MGFSVKTVSMRSIYIEMKNPKWVNQNGSAFFTRVMRVCMCVCANTRRYTNLLDAFLTFRNQLRSQH